MYKRGFFISTIILINIILNVHSVYASKGQNNLNLDTEILNNKKEDYNSTTFVNGMELFSIDYEEQLKKEQKSSNLYWNKISKNVFAGKIEKARNEESTSDLFNNEVSFDKIPLLKEKSVKHKPIIIASALILMFLTYILTKRKYKTESRKDDNSAYSLNFHE
ncbi:hypothetical protein ACTQ4K_00735 [Clostridium sporogenes]|uniref:hypothetical protein n=1 Tax=Clostridium sporogenes TaxID=1509 RepID=UPI003F8F27C8